MGEYFPPLLIGHTVSRKLYKLAAAIFLLGTASAFENIAQCDEPDLSDPVTGAQSQEAQRDADRFAAEAFGKLPVRFNGRVTTIATVAPIVLAKISGRSYYIDTDGEKQTSVRWLLDFLAGGNAAQSQHLFPIKNAQLLKGLGLDDDPRVRRYRTAAEQSSETLNLPRFSASEIRSKTGWMDRERKRVSENLTREEPSEYVRSLLELRSQTHQFILVETLHRFPNLSNDREEIKRFLETLDLLFRR